MNIWENLPELIEKNLSCFPYHEKIVELLMTHEEESLPNILLYGAKGFPKEHLWYAAVLRMYGKYHKKECVWNKEWTYNETSKFLEIDFKHPSQPKDMSSLSNFLKEVIVHTSFEKNHRHIIVLKNIEYMCMKGYNGVLRVLLERYSANAWFICTTNHIGKIEPPIKSRFMMIRIPLPATNEINNFMEKNNRQINTSIEGLNKYNLYYHIYISELIKNNINCDIKTLCNYSAPFIYDFYDNKDGYTIEQIRNITQKLSIHGFSFLEIALDMLKHIPEKKHSEWINVVSDIDHLCSQTDGYRKPLYIEYILNIASTYGNTVNKK